MKKSVAFLLTAMLFAACGGLAPAPAAPEAAKPLITPAPAANAPVAAVPVTPAPEMKQPDTAVTPAAAPVADAAVMDPELAKLIGTTWTMPDGTEVTFTDGKKAHAKGGAAAIAGPAGLNLDFVYDNGKFTVSAMGKTLDGTWDGENLTVDGAAGTKKVQ